MKKRMTGKIMVAAVACFGLLLISPLSEALLSHYSLSTGVNPLDEPAIIENKQFTKEEKQRDLNRGLIVKSNSDSDRVAIENDKQHKLNPDSQGQPNDNTVKGEEKQDVDNSSRSNSGDKNIVVKREFKKHMDVVAPDLRADAKPVSKPVEPNDDMKVQPEKQQPNPNNSAENPDKMVTNSHNDARNVDQGLSPQKAYELVKNKFNYEGIDYTYVGEAKDFKALKDAGRHGQVFIPNVPTDIGYYVDSKDSKIYYFHPSGYLDEAK